jgi:hypothetical protein
MMYGLKTQVSVLATVMATSIPAMAGDFGFAFSFSKHRHHRHGVDVGVVIGRPRVALPAPVLVPAPVIAPAPVPVVPVVPVRPILVPPVYTTVAERVWVPTVQTHFRDVPVYDICGRIVSYRREPYTVSSGYWTVVQKRVMVRERYWTTAVDTDAAPPVHEGYSEPDQNSIPDDDFGNVDDRGLPAPYGNGSEPGGVRASAIQHRGTTY